MFDLHSHILPGFDDGARNGETSLAMINTAERTGTRQIIATPHVMEGAWIPLWSDIITGCQELQMVADDSNLDINILPGAEVALYPDMLKLITGPGPYCINGGRYMLVELPSSVIPLYADEFFFTLQLYGITPILAHPERHPGIRRDVTILEKWIKHGVLVQVNGPSLTGKLGDKIKVTAEKLLKLGLVHCIGSDAHNNSYRSPDLERERKKIRELIGTRWAEQILFENPECIVSNQGLRNKNSVVAQWHGKKKYV